ncbi:phosphotransferase [Streptomyces sp. GKU 257-1]|nr:phosphotransferase [Streptomyces sp. GKU 257-1]
MATSVAFTEDLAREVLAAATNGAGGTAELLSLGENAVFALDGTVVRVGRDAQLLARAEHELRVATWLESEGVPAVPRGGAGGPPGRRASGHLLAAAARRGAPGRTRGPGRAAAARARAARAPPFVLPPRELLDGIERWLRLAGDAVPREDAAFLRARRDDILAALPGLVPHLPPGPLHGDALPRNVHITPQGPLLVDLETFSSDLREHDLVVMALSRDRYGLPAAEYESFCAGYGWDVREWEGCAVLRGARETASCAWVSPSTPPATPRP